MTDFEIRTAGAQDLPALQDVFRRASLSNADDVDALLTHPEVLVFAGDHVDAGRTRVATRDGQVVGFATAQRTDDGYELDDLFVDPDWMRRGVARLLVGDAVSSARSDGVTRIDVTANPHAAQFYESVGFVSDGPVETLFGAATRMHLTVADR